MRRIGGGPIAHTATCGSICRAGARSACPPGPGLMLEAPLVLNRTCALDFMGGALYHGRCYRTLNLLDEGNRVALAIASLPSVRVVRLLAQLVAVHGAPNGPPTDAEAADKLVRGPGDRAAAHTDQEAQPERPH